jgi:hypothetical protein
MSIDINYNFQEELNREGRSTKDIDTYSRTLHQYHHCLWLKELPYKKGFFEIEKSKSKNGPFKFIFNDVVYTSDAIFHTFRNFKRKSMKTLIAAITKKDATYIESFHQQGNTIGGYVIFPGKKRNGKQTINQSRGFNSLLNDRFDLALECIRRFYLGEYNTPLGETLLVYKDFFELFTDFKGYVDFFLLNDLVSSDYKTIQFWHAFESFDESPSLPSNEAEYEVYRSNLINFVTKRNQRIQQLKIVCKV